MLWIIVSIKNESLKNLSINGEASKSKNEFDENVSLSQI